jgi:DNA polymerase III sliding clamp (beta) subunit (PCNA family)
MSNAETALVRVQHDEKPSGPSWAIPLPEHNLPPSPEIDEDEAIPHPDVEIISAEEERHREQLKDPPPPETILEATPPVRPSMVPLIEADAELLLGFLAAAELPSLEDGTPPVAGLAKMSFFPANGSDKPRLFLEAANASVWMGVSMSVHGGGADEHSSVLPIQRAIGVLRRIRTQYNSVYIGMEKEQINFGAYSIPYGGLLENFPNRPPVLIGEVRVAFPAFYVEQVLSKLLPAIGHDISKPQMTGIILDISSRVALSTDGYRMHLVKMPRIPVDTKPGMSPPMVTVPPIFFKVLAAVVDREWAAVEIGEKQIVAGGSDYAVIAKTVMEGLDWRKAVPGYKGYWVVDKTSLVGVLTDAMAVAGEGEVQLNIDALSEKLMVTAKGLDGDRFQKPITAKRFDGPARVCIVVNPRYMLDAAASCAGGLIQLLFDDGKDDKSMAPMMVRGDDEEFLAVIAPYGGKS